jgi:hypothetical protein
MKKGRIEIMAAVALLAGFAIGLISWATAADTPITCWVLCNQDSRVNVRKEASKKSAAVGFLELGDSFLTDGETRNGYVHALGTGEYGDGWIYSGYVSTEEPAPVFERYVCTAKTRVACRRWMGGPLTSRPWLNNGTDVMVFYIADGWALTARGYIQAEWLGADPE